MRSPRRNLLAEHLPILLPAAMLTVFFVVPFAIMLAMSFFRRVQGAFYEPDFVLDNYARFLSLFFAERLGFSLFLAALVAAICIAVGLPFTYQLARLGRRPQIVWLIGLLSILSLSEVIIGFAWSTLLSRTAGITNLFAAIGLIREAVSLSPSFGAVLLGMAYQAFPYTVLILYPSVARLDSSLVEAARTLGASPIVAFFMLVVPVLRNALLATFIMVFVFALGSYLLPQLLGRPRHWTLSVLITDQAIYQSNMPFAAAMAVFLVLVSLALVALSLFVGRRGAVA